jgi:hypothetical protein
MTGDGLPEDPCPRWCETDHRKDTTLMRHLRLIRDRGEEGVSVWLARTDTWSGHRGKAVVELTLWFADGSGHRRTALEPTTARLVSHLLERGGGDRAFAGALSTAAGLLCDPSRTSPASRPPWR